MKYIVDDLLNDKTFDYTVIRDKMVLSFVPKLVIKKYVENELLKKEVFSLIKEGKIVDPLNYKNDFNLKRSIWLFLRKINYIRKYKNNKW